MGIHQVGNIPALLHPQGLQGSAQLDAVIRAADHGIDLAIVWNKSHREHQIVGTHPAAVRTEADEAEVQAVVTKAVKRRKEAAEQMAAGGRPELAEKEGQESEILAAAAGRGELRIATAFYELTTGDVPFDAETFNELLFKIVLETLAGIQEAFNGAQSGGTKVSLADLIVLAGGSGRTLAFGPGHLSASAMPGQVGNMIIAGHRDTHFQFLQKVEVGELLEDAGHGQHGGLVVKTADEADRMR